MKPVKLGLRGRIVEDRKLLAKIVDEIEASLVRLDLTDKWNDPKDAVLSDLMTEIGGRLRWSCPLHGSADPEHDDFSEDGDGCLICQPELDMRPPKKRGRPLGGGRTPEEEKAARVDRELRRYQGRRERGVCVRCQAPSPDHNECASCSAKRRGSRAVARTAVPPEERAHVANAVARELLTPPSAVEPEPTPAPPSRR